MERKIIVQKWRKRVEDPVEMGIKYYTLLSVVNNLSLTPRQIELLSFTSYYGTISSLQAKTEFCKRFGSTPATVANMMTKLSSLNYLVREGKKLVVNKDIDFNFENDFILRVELNGHQEGSDTENSK